MKQKVVDYSVIYNTGLPKMEMSEFKYYLNTTKKHLAIFRETDGHGNEDLGSIDEYGIVLEYGPLYEVNPAIAEKLSELSDKPAIFWQIYTGGPGDDITIVYNGDSHRIFYRFLPWFHGICIEVTGDPDFEWVAEYFKERIEI